MPQEKQIEALNKAVFGNGRPGLKTEVTEMKVHQEQIECHLKELARSFTGLNNVMMAHDANDRAKIKVKEGMHKTLKTVSTIVSIAGVLITVILKHGA